MSTAPVAYFVFNRPWHTEQTFSVLRKQRPGRLFVIADGPRPAHSTDPERCAEVRSIVEQVDWPCQVQRNYSKVNLGLKRRVSSGLDWVFRHVERAIVLEDDCVPHPDFFRFCDELLERFASDERVSVITGNNFQNGRRRGTASYYFSKYNHCWGWATWRRVWQHYQGELPFWPEWSKSDDWFAMMNDRVERRYWEKIFDRVHAGEIDSWAYPWTACVWYLNGLTATPKVNLVSNIGFGCDSTHTAAANSSYARMATTPIGPIEHLAEVAQDLEADRYVFDHHFDGRWRRFPQSFFRLPVRVAAVAVRLLRQAAR